MHSWQGVARCTAPIARRYGRARPRCAARRSAAHPRQDGGAGPRRVYRAEPAPMSPDHMGPGASRTAGVPHGDCQRRAHRGLKRRRCLSARIASIQPQFLADAAHIRLDFQSDDWRSAVLPVDTVCRRAHRRKDLRWQKGMEIVLRVEIEGGHRRPIRPQRREARLHR